MPRAFFVYHLLRVSIKRLKPFPVLSFTLEPIISKCGKIRNSSLFSVLRRLRRRRLLMKINKSPTFSTSGQSATATGLKIELNFLRLNWICFSLLKQKLPIGRVLRSKRRLTDEPHGITKTYAGPSRIHHSGFWCRQFRQKQVKYMVILRETLEGKESDYYKRRRKKTILIFLSTPGFSLQIKKKDGE